MRDLESDVLRLLRVFGPCSCVSLAKRAGLIPKSTYRALYALENMGLVEHPSFACWDVSDSGRRWFDENAQKQLFL